MRISDPRTKTYDFETTDQLSAIIFCKLLDMFDISYVEDVTPSYIGSSYVKFWCNPKKRTILEYVYRRYCRLDRLYLININGYQDNANKLRRDGYAIY